MTLFLACQAPHLPWFLTHLSLVTRSDKNHDEQSVSMVQPVRACHHARMGELGEKLCCNGVGVYRWCLVRRFPHVVARAHGPRTV